MGRQYVPRSWDPNHVNCTSSGQLCDCCCGGGIAGFPAAASYAYLLLMLCVPLVFFFFYYSLFSARLYYSTHTHAHEHARHLARTHTNATIITQHYCSYMGMCVDGHCETFLFVSFFYGFIPRM